MNQEYKTFNVEIKIPIIKKQEGIIPNTFDVLGMYKYLEDFLAGYISSKNQINKPDNKSRFNEAKFLLKEFIKFALMKEAGVKTTPIEK